MADIEIVMGIIIMELEICTVNTTGPHAPTGAMSASIAGSTEITTIFTMIGAIPTVAVIIAGGIKAGTRGNDMGGMATRTGMVGETIHDGMMTGVIITPPGLGGNDPAVHGT